MNTKVIYGALALALVLIILSIRSKFIRPKDLFSETYDWDEKETYWREKLSREDYYDTIYKVYESWIKSNDPTAKVWLGETIKLLKKEAQNKSIGTFGSPMFASTDFNDPQKAATKIAKGEVKRRKRIDDYEKAPVKDIMVEYYRRFYNIYK